MPSIRKMRESDLDDVELIEKECFTDPWSRTSLASVLKDDEISHYFVLEYLGEIIGYFGIIMVLGECEIHNIAVIKKYQNKGFGKLMMSYIIEKCKKHDIEKIILEVREFNFQAIGVYTKMGFKKIGRIAGYYRHPQEDGLLMCLELKNER